MRPRLVAYALAASMVLGVGLTMLRDPGLRDEAVPAVTASPQPMAIKSVHIRPSEVQPVRLVFNSRSALSGVSFKVSLPEGVEFANYPGLRELAWHVDLQPGANVLELPVRLHGSGGILTASLTHGSQQREFSVRVQAKHDSGNSNTRVVTMLADRRSFIHSTMETIYHA